MNDIKYPFVMYPSPEGGYVAAIPSLKGCIAQGETINETLVELAIVEQLWLETASNSGITIPSPEPEIRRVIDRLAA